MTNIKWKELKFAILSTNGNSIAHKILKYAKRLLKAGIKHYLKGEYVITSTGYTSKQEKYHYSHKGKIPLCSRETRLAS